MGTTATERSRSLRESRRAEGLVRIEFWLTQVQAAKVRAFVEKLTRPSKKA